MKTISAFLMLLFLMQVSWAESPCDIRPGVSIGLGLKVIEFASGHVVHSKINMRESTPEAIQEEMINLQDMGVCTENIISQKCVFRLEKEKSMIKSITLFRGKQKWNTWAMKAKKDAETFVRNMKKIGFCS